MKLWSFSLTVLITVSTPQLFAAQAGCNGVRRLADCPVTGCEERGSDEGLFNQLKRRQATGTRPVRLFFKDFRTLQRAADAEVGQRVTLSRSDRQKLKGTLTNGLVAEGRFVKVVGFIGVGPPGPHANSSGESVNCKLKNQANNDFHISLVEHQGETEFASIVVEMIPQRRPAGWTIPRLNRIERDGHKVLVTGALFYDNEHVVNADSRHPIGGQPKRFSLWEIHPIKEFLVCLRPNNSCNETRLNEWTTLLAFTPNL